jgi:hypothetical protein
VMNCATSINIGTPENPTWKELGMSEQESEYDFLLAALRLHPDATGVKIRFNIEDRSRTYEYWEKEDHHWYMVRYVDPFDHFYESNGRHSQKTLICHPTLDEAMNQAFTS